MFITGTCPAAPRSVDVGALVRTGGREGLEVFVPVLVEVRVWVEVPAPGRVTVGVGRGEVEARGEATPAALPVGEVVAVVTSRYSTTSTSVTTGTETLA